MTIDIINRFLLKRYFIFFHLLLFLFPYVGTCQVPSYVFYQLSIKDGLSEGTVRAIVEDKRGFMWFGTEDGLNKYDGYTFTVYKTDPKDSFSITSNNTKCFYNDRKGNLWIGTRHGVNIYDHLQDRFYNANSTAYPVLQYIEGDIERMQEDNNGTIWILSSTHGLYKITSLYEKPQRFQYTSGKDISIFISFYIKNDRIYIGTNDGLLLFNTTQNTFSDVRNIYGRGYQVRAIYLDKNNIWIATTQGLRKINTSTGEIKEYKNNLADKNTLNGNNTIRFLAQGNQLLIAIDGSGIDLMDLKTETFHHYTKEGSSQLSSNNITAIYMDSKQTLWVGTFLNGINFSNINTNFFVSVKNSTSPEISVKNGVVTSFLKDHNSNFWITTDGGGLYLKKKNASGFTNFIASDKKQVVASNAVLGILEDADKNIWISTYAGGLTRINPKGTATIFRHDPHDPTSLGWDKIKGLCEYNGQLWISTIGMGLSVFDKKTETFKTYRFNRSNKDGIPSDWIYWFLKDHKGTLWMATFNGLTKYIPEEDKFKTYRFNEGAIAVDKNYVFDIFEDSYDNLWIGTNGGGLVLFDRDNEKFTSYTIKDGFSDNAVRTIIEDRNGNLWAATNNGITKFNIKTRKAVPYTINDGLPAGSFYFNSKYIDEKGDIYFGMNNGYLVINPSLATDKIEFPKVIFTELKIFNNIVTPKTIHSPLDRAITEATHVTLPYNQNVFSVEFATLNFNIPKQNYYSYKLEGFDNDWNYSGKDRIAKYTNIAPGNYVLLVRASSSENTWGNSVTRFYITVTPPFWLTWWFRMAIIAMVLMAGITFFQLRTRNIRKRNEWLTDQVKERTIELQESNYLLIEQNHKIVNQSEQIIGQQKDLLNKKYELEKNNEQLAEWNEFQKRLIGVLGHDLRGPLNHFSLLLKYFDKDSSEFVMEKLKSSADSITELAANLLSWVSFQSSNQELQFVNFTYKEIIEKTLKELEPQYVDKKISFSIKNENCLAKGIVPLAHTALRNIISNAIKFSPQGGVIEIEGGIEKEEHTGIRITDYGKGFDAATVNKLIMGEAFRGMKESTLESAGLGMAICYDMVKRTGGWIEAASLPQSGATFYIFFPRVNEIEKVKQEEIPHKELFSTEKTNILKDKKILLVDDEDSARWPIVRVFSEYTEVYEVRSAEEALKWIKVNTPDMALLDIRMPGISGIELCKKIKNSADTAHVPCIIVSGEESVDIRTEAFKAGADVFLIKPVHPEELLLQICSYFDNHAKKLKRFFNEDDSVDQLTENPLNKEFLQKLIKMLEDNLTSENLNVDFIATEMGLSRSSLYRKLRSLTGETVNDFIRNIRMRKGLLLLKEGKLNISEVAYETGFKSLSYFTTSFKKHFGYNPTELKSK
jgi:ligand-binding sensor domain-containing protein/signal transduction histidine kinase/DNA-binding response OmpR family regulator